MNTRFKRLSTEWIGLSLSGWVVSKFIDAGKSALVFEAFKGVSRAAIKIFDPEIIERFGEDEEKERIARELELVGAHHPNLIQILDGGFDANSGLFFIVMEYLDAPNLATVLELVPVERVGDLISQVASAAEFLHDRGIVHRDIKPDNIAISHDFTRAILLDLGVIRPYEKDDSKPLTDQEKKLFIGTLQYSSPEFLLREEEQTPEGFLSLTMYQLGAVLHDMLMRKRIFSDQTDPYARLVQAVLHETPHIDPSGLPLPLVALARNCLVKKAPIRIQLVSWQSFRHSVSSDIPAAAKERIRRHRVKATYEATEEPETGWEVKHQQQHILVEMLGSIEQQLREECTSDDLPPRLIKNRLIDDGQFGLVELVFSASGRYGLHADLLILLRVSILDYEARVIRLDCAARVGPGVTDLSVSDSPWIAIFNGVYDDSTVRAALIGQLYPLVAEAMDTPIGNDPAWLTVQAG
jgi:eukaryotic-like serine/threonine-protein kinase